MRDYSFYVQAVAFCCSPLSARIMLVRHGSHDEVGRVLSGRSDIALNAAGRAEAAALANALVHTPLAAIHSSPRRRATETAQALAAVQRLDVTIEDGLDEIDFGDWTGRSFAGLDPEPAWQHWNAARGSARVPGGEDMAEVTARATAAVARNMVEGATVACVSHCDVIRALAAHYLGLDADRLLSFDVDPASLTILDLDGAHGRVVAINRLAA